jgi:hypothetical protein
VFALPLGQKWQRPCGTQRAAIACATRRTVRPLRRGGRRRQVKGQYRSSLPDQLATRHQPARRMRPGNALSSCRPSVLHSTGDEQGVPAVRRKWEQYDSRKAWQFGCAQLTEEDFRAAWRRPDCGQKVLCCIPLLSPGSCVHHPRRSGHIRLFRIRGRLAEARSALCTDLCLGSQRGFVSKAAPYRNSRVDRLTKADNDAAGALSNTLYFRYRRAPNAVHDVFDSSEIFAHESGTLGVRRRFAPSLLRRERLSRDQV